MNRPASDLGQTANRSRVLRSSRGTVWYPLGCGVEISTNSQLVLEAAESVWGEYPANSDRLSARLQIVVSDLFSTLAIQQPLPRGYRHLYSVVDSAANYAAADLNSGAAMIRLSANAVADRRYFLDTYLEPLTYLILGSRHFAMVHASCVALNGRAVLLCGDSGAGKTCLAYMCARAGWDFVSGDAMQIARSSTAHEVVGRPYSIRFRQSACRLFAELHAFPVSARGAKLDIECSTAKLGLSTALHACATHVVFLNRHYGCPGARIENYDREPALTSLEQAVFYGDENVRNDQRRTLRRLLELPVLQLTYSDLNDAERALRQLVVHR